MEIIFGVGLRFLSDLIVVLSWRCLDFSADSWIVFLYQTVWVFIAL